MKKRKTTPAKKATPAIIAKSKTGSAGNRADSCANCAGSKTC